MMESMAEDGSLELDRVRIFWTIPGYSHCCFTSQSKLSPKLAAKLEAAFLSVIYEDPIGKLVLEGEDCDHLLQGTDTGWALIEKAAEAEGLI